MAKVATDRKKSRQANGYVAHLVIFALSVMLMMVSKADITAINSIRGLVVQFVLPAADAFSVPFRAIGSMVEGIESVANIRDDNIRLRGEVEQLRRWKRQAEILIAENRELRALGKVPIPQGMTSVAARVIAINADSFAHVVMIDVGAEKGIRKGSPVTTPDGLAGMIVDVRKGYAQVLLITDLNAMIPVILTGTSWPAITAGINADLLELRYLSTQVSVEVGELVQTSGHGGVLPPGLPLGRIAQASPERIMVKPIVDLQKLNYVTVLVTPYQGRPGDDLYEQTFSPVPPTDDPFSLEGINALGRKVGDDDKPESNP